MYINSAENSGVGGVPIKKINKQIIVLGLNINVLRHIGLLLHCVLENIF